MDLKFLNAFNIILPGARESFEKLERHFGNLEKAWFAGESEIKNAGLGEGAIKELAEKRKNIDPEKEWQKLKNEGILVLGENDKNYPSLLKEIHQRPHLLYIRGDLPKETDICIAIVGSRKYSSYGKQVCESISGGLSGCGIVVISGLALGIDTIAHQAVLDAGGKTIAVLGTGIDDKSIYPAQNFNLAKNIINGGGAIISEFAPGTPALPHHFPMRNRIVSGLSKGVVVVEAAEKSGALITATIALEQNREVFAVPGPIHSENSKGTNNLIKQGAKLTTSADDILEEIAPQFLNNSGDKIQNEINLTNLSKEEKNLLSLLSNGEMELDQLLKSASIPANQFNSILTMLEIKGIIRNQGGKIYKVSL